MPPARFENDDMVCAALRVHVKALRERRDSGDFSIAPPHVVIKLNDEINKITKFLSLSRKERTLALLSELLG